MSAKGRVPPSPGPHLRGGAGRWRILRGVLRTVLLVVVTTATSLLTLAVTAAAGSLLEKPAAETRAKAVLVLAAKDAGVALRRADAQATCTRHAKLPNTFECRLSERRRRCTGRTQIYTSGERVVKSRATQVTCVAKR
jgi:hypothetical protein